MYQNGKQDDSRKVHLRTSTGRFVHNDLRNNRDDSCKQAVMLSNIFLSNYD